MILNLFFLIEIKSLEFGGKTISNLGSPYESLGQLLELVPLKFERLDGIKYLKGEFPDGRLTGLNSPIRSLC